MAFYSNEPIYYGYSPRPNFDAMNDDELQAWLEYSRRELDAMNSWERYNRPRKNYRQRARKSPEVQKISSPVCRIVNGTCAACEQRRKLFKPGQVMGGPDRFSRIRECER